MFPENRDCFPVYTYGPVLMRRCRKCNNKRNGASRKKNPTYESFRSAKARCNCKTNIDYPNYGGRGILCKFISWQQLAQEIGERPLGKTLDRIDTNGNYEVGNVRWATAQQQHRNTRVFKSTPNFIAFVKILTILGMPRKDICTYTKVSATTVDRAVNCIV